jgi:hypothetical protein
VKGWPAAVLRVDEVVRYSWKVGGVGATAGFFECEEGLRDVMDCVVRCPFSVDDGLAERQADGVGVSALWQGCYKCYP